MDKVLGESAGSMLGRDLEALIQQARDYKKEYNDSFVSVEHSVLAFVQDKRFGKQLFKDFQISLKALKNAVESIRGSQTVIDKGCLPSSQPIVVKAKLGSKTADKQVEEAGGAVALTA